VVMQQADYQHSPQMTTKSRNTTPSTMLFLGTRHGPGTERRIGEVFPGPPDLAVGATPRLSAYPADWGSGEPFGAASVRVLLE
jgi:hypothetical protein